MYGRTLLLLAFVLQIPGNCYNVCCTDARPDLFADILRAVGSRRQPRDFARGVRALSRPPRSLIAGQRPLAGTAWPHPFVALCQVISCCTCLLNPPFAAPHTESLVTLAFSCAAAAPFVRSNPFGDSNFHHQYFCIFFLIIS